MTLRRMDNILIVVNDMAAAIDFFVALGMTLEGSMPLSSAWVDQVVGLEGVDCEIAMLRTPDGHGAVELTTFRTPAALPAQPAHAPVNTLGLRRIMFAVEDLDAMLERLRPHGAELVGSIAQYEDFYRLCFIRGPEGIIIGLAEQLG